MGLRKPSFNWPKSLGPLSNQKRLRHSVTGLGGSPRKFEMADGLLAAGGLGSQAMVPQPERTGWAVEESTAPLEKGEHPLCRARGAAF